MLNLLNNAEKYPFWKRQDHPYFHNDSMSNSISNHLFARFNFSSHGCVYILSRDSQPLQLVTLAFEHVQWQRTDEICLGNSLTLE